MIKLPFDNAVEQWTKLKMIYDWTGEFGFLLGWAWFLLFVFLISAARGIMVRIETWGGRLCMAWIHAILFNGFSIVLVDYFISLVSSRSGLQPHLSLLFSFSLSLLYLLVDMECTPKFFSCLCFCTQNRSQPETARCGRWNILQVSPGYCNVHCLARNFYFSA